MPRGFKRDLAYALFYYPSKGFCELAATDKMVLVGQVSGDGRFWRDFAENWARELGLKVGGTICGRKEARAYMRLFGYKVTGEEEKGGFKRYRAVNKKGGWYLMTECELANGDRAYWVTWEVK